MNTSDLIKRHEGLRLHVYQDTRGISTIGYGRNLVNRGISPTEANILLANDIQYLTEELMLRPWFRSLSAPRQAVVLDMAFNMGLSGMLSFTHMIAELGAGNWSGAAAAMLNSSWARELPNRAQEDADIMEKGVWPALP